VRIIIDTAADPTVHSVTAAAVHILAAESDTAATLPTGNPLPDLERPFAAADGSLGLNSSSGLVPHSRLRHYVPARPPQISSSPTGQARTVVRLGH